MEIYNITGKKVSEQTIRITEGINYFDLPGGYKTGSYCLKISGKKFSQSKVFVVVN